MGYSNSWTHLHAQIHSTLRQRQLLKPRQAILVAVSGGQDSLCLLKLLLDLQLKWSWQVAIAHCDHRWSTDAGIADRVRQIAQDWQVPFYLKTASEVKETEAAARSWRYQALVEIAQDHDFSVIVAGHTKSDRAETFLFNLLRGAGIDGLTALTWKRPLTPHIDLVRPLLELSRQQTGDFCKEFNLPVWEDAVNQNLHYARNRIRNELIPYLQAHFNPQVENAIAQTAELQRADLEYLETTAQELLQQAMLITGWEQPEASPRRLNRQCLRSVPLALQRRVMRKFLQQYLPKAVSFEQIEALTHLINAPNLSRTSTLSKGIYAEVRGDWIELKGTTE